MRLPLYTFKCANCGNESTAPVLSVYGMFALRSDKAEHTAYCNAIEDSVFQECAEFVRDLVSETERVDATQYAFGATCDLAPDGTRFRIGRRPTCPSCGYRYTSWRPADPPATVEVSSVTHCEWSQLSLAERRERIREDLQKRGSSPSS